MKPMVCHNCKEVIPRPMAACWFAGRGFCHDRCSKEWRAQRGRSTIVRRYWEAS